jgi:hypothetical protein
MACSQCEGCKECEGGGVAKGVFIGAVVAAIICMLIFVPSGSDRHTCSEACEKDGHTVSAFDVQRGCVCSDPFPATRKWVRP